MLAGLNHVAHGGLAKKYNVAVMSDEQGANGAGHEGIALERPDGKYHYFSKNEAEYYVLGKPKVSNLIVDNLAAANEIYREASGGKSYDKIAIFKATKSQIQRGISAAKAFVNSYYSLIGNSCTTLVSQTMASTFGVSWRTLFEHSIPRLNFEIRKSTYNYYYTGTIKVNSPQFISHLKYLD